MALERPQLADRPPPSPPRRAPKPRSDFLRRLSYYMTGVVIGVLLVIPILSAKCSARRAAQSAGAPGGVVAPGGPVSPSR